VMDVATDMDHVCGYSSQTISSFHHSSFCGSIMSDARSTSSVSTRRGDCCKLFNIRTAFSAFGYLYFENNCRIHLPLRTVKAREYAARAGDPNVSNALSKLSNLSFAPNGNWDSKASQGTSHIQNCWENADHWKRSWPVPQCEMHESYVNMALPWLSIFPVRVGSKLLVELRHWWKSPAEEGGANPTMTAMMNSWAGPES